MTVATRRRALALIVAITVAAPACGLWLSDERAIGRRLNEIARLLSVPANETDVARITRIAGLRKYLGEHIRVRYGGQEATSREAIVGALAQWGRSADGVTVEFVDVQVTASGHDVATVYMTVKVTSNDNDTIDAREVEVRLSNSDSAMNPDWIVTSAESRETLSK